MYRRVKVKNATGVVEEKVCGVLTDYDLSSWTRSLTEDYTKTSQQRTGTPPFMAHGLLDGSDNLHLYRHDAESIFYIMLILATHYEIQAPTKGKGGGARVRKGNLSFQDWFDAPNYNMLGGIKSDFFTKRKVFEVSPSFKDFRCWLLQLQKSFGLGSGAKQQQKYMEPEESFGEDTFGENTPPATFDEETLGGHVTYNALISPARRLTGELKGLVIRYPPPPPPPASGTQNVGA